MLNLTRIGKSDGACGMLRFFQTIGLLVFSEARIVQIKGGKLTSTVEKIHFAHLSLSTSFTFA